MLLQEQIREAYQSATGYPDLVFKLISLGIQSYTVDVATGIILYRFEGGGNEVHLDSKFIRLVAEAFDRELTIKAIKDNQQGKSDYLEFMDDIARAGVRFYEATFTGNLRVTYIGVGELYEEAIPV